MIILTPTANVYLRSAPSPRSRAYTVLREGKNYEARDFTITAKQNGYQWLKLLDLQARGTTYPIAYIAAPFANVEIQNTDPDPATIPEPEYIAPKEELEVAGRLFEAVLVAVKRVQDNPEALPAMQDILKAIQQLAGSENITAIIAYMKDFIDDK